MRGSIRRAVAARAETASEQRRLAAADRRSAMLGRLAGVETVLTDAEQVIAKGWVQCAWYAGTDGDEPAAACLVGAIVHAAGGRSDDEVAQKAVAVTWSTLLGRDDDPDTSVAPALRVARRRELTAWNDAPQRTSVDVRALLRRSAARVRAAREQVAAVALHI